jgi:hypothetical protein
MTFKSKEITMIVPVCDKPKCNFFTELNLTLGLTGRGYVGQVICTTCKHKIKYDLYTRLEVGE